MTSFADMLSPEAGDRLLGRLRELEHLDRLVRERSQQQPPDPRRP